MSLQQSVCQESTMLKERGMTRTQGLIDGEVVPEDSQTVRHSFQQLTANVCKSMWKKKKKKTMKHGQGAAFDLNQQTQ